MKQLCILGDSVMKGIIYRSGAGMHSYTLCDDGTFGPLTERGISVINRSRMGATVRYCGDRLDRLLPDTSDGRFAVLFEYGGNDSDHDWRAVSECPEGEHRPVTGPEEFVAVYKRNIERAKEAGAAVALTNLVPIDPDLYFRHIARGLSAGNILSWLGNVGMLYRFHEYYNGNPARRSRERLPAHRHPESVPSLARLPLAHLRRRHPPEREGTQAHTRDPGGELREYVLRTRRGISNSMNQT